MYISIDTQELKQRFDLRLLAERYTQLKKTSGDKELMGPCPKCGGEDRFHVRSDWFFCRHCYPIDNGKSHDVIGFTMWFENLDFKEAVARLDGGLSLTAPPPTLPKAKETSKEKQGWDQSRAESLVGRGHVHLCGATGKLGQEYLSQRGLKPHTWEAFCIGFNPAVSIPKTEGKEKAPAIVIPWYRKKRLYGVRFRFLEVQDGHKQTALFGSDFSGVYGGHVIPGVAEHLRTLIICEGEINAMSIWQSARNTALDVLSTGSETAKLTPAMITYTKKFAKVITWFDKSEVAKKQARDIGAYALSSPNGADANDLLQSGDLGGFISTARARACTNNEERKRLLWNLWDATYSSEDADPGIVVTAKSLAALLVIPLS